MSLYITSYTESYPQLNFTHGANNSLSISGVVNELDFSISFTHHGNNVGLGHVPDTTTTNLTPFEDPMSVSSTPTPNMDIDNAQVLQFIVTGIMGSILAVLGFLGNALSIVVLQRRQMRSSTSYYLMSLAIYDNCQLLGMMIYFCLPALAPYTSSLKDYSSFVSLTIPVGYPLSLAAQMGSIYTCVGFTVERFIAVCRPLHVANTCTKSRTVRAIILIFVWSILYNIPRFFQFQVHYVREEDMTSGPLPSSNIPAYSDNSSAGIPCSEILTQHTSIPCVSHTDPHTGSNNGLVNMTSTQIARAMSEALVSLTNSSLPTAERTSSPQPGLVIHQETEFGSDPTFQHLYLIYSQLFFMFLVPFLIILVMNVGLIRAVKGSKSMHQSMCASARKEHNLTVMLIAVIVVFLVCQFPTIIDNILFAVVGDNRLKRNYAYMCFWTLCTFMVEINAASNFLLYCFFGKKFRMMLLSILGLKRKQHHVAYRSTVCKSRTNGTRIYELEVSVM